MSLIHLDKSVLTLHFKEILEDGHFGGPFTLLGLSALIYGSKLMIPSSRTTKLRVNPPYRPHMSLSEWVANAQKQQQKGSAIAVARARVSESGSENTSATEKIAA